MTIINFIATCVIARTINIYLAEIIMSKTKDTVTVAQFLTYHIERNYRTQREIAMDIGYTKPNIITMFKQGLTKLPLEKIGIVAEVLEIDPGVLFYKVMSEYMPETLLSLKPILQALELSDEEVELIKFYREHHELYGVKLEKKKKQRRSHG